MKDSKVFKKFDRIIDSVQNPLQKLLKKITINQYDREFKYVATIIPQEENNTGFVILTDLYYKQAKRMEIVNTLMNSEYTRTGKKWSKYETIAFMDLIISAEKFNDKRKKNTYKTVAEKFNIPENKIKSTLSIFIRNMENGDRLDLYNYFSRYEILEYKYKDLEKFQKDVEENKISKEDIKYVKKLFELE